MTNQTIENLLNYLLDTETTSEITFTETIRSNEELFLIAHLKDWELIVLRKLKDLHQNVVVTMVKLDGDAQPTASDGSGEDESSSSDNEEEGGGAAEKEQEAEKKPIGNQRTRRAGRMTDIYVDIGQQSQRLLRLLYHCEQNHPHFADLYYQALDRCMKSGNHKIVTIVLEQLAIHAFESSTHEKQCPRMAQWFTSNVSPSNITTVHQPIFDAIQTILSTNKSEVDPTAMLLTQHIDLLYPYATRFLDLRQEFRDSSHYFIDGDSFLLSMAHHTNVHLDSNYGNTLHVIFIIERILVMLFNQAHRWNFTLVFFDCHHRLYREESPILSLLRAGLLAHLSRNAERLGATKVRQFSSWLEEEYVRFANEEKPTFIFYHDMSTFDFDNDSLLSKNALEQLYYTYRLFGNYHQYVLQSHLYLMNKLILTDTTVKCFQVQFNRMCPQRLQAKLVRLGASHAHANGVDESRRQTLATVCQEIADGDVRLFIYLETVADLLEEDKDDALVKLLSPLLVLHVALLIRISLADRHLTSCLPPVECSPAFTQCLRRFQQRLASNISSCSSSLSWSKIADLFDGRLFNFTLHQIHQSQSNIQLDSQTRTMVERSLTVLNQPTGESLFRDKVNQMVQSKDITFSTATTESQAAVSKKRPTIVKISNPFVDTYLKPILTSKTVSSTFDLVDPNEKQLAQYKNKSIWHDYKEVGEEITRVPDNDVAAKTSSKSHRYRTKTQQELYNYFTLYGKSLTTRDVRDGHIQIVLPTASSSAALVDDEATAGDRAESASASAGDKKKKQQHKNQPKKVVPTKADKIKEQNKQRIMNGLIDDETNKLAHVEGRLKLVPLDDFADAIEVLDECLPSFATPVNRLELLKRKFDLQRKFLRSLKKKSTLTIGERSKFELLQIDFFASMAEITHLENVLDPFTVKKKFMEELVDDAALDAEKWYRFQLEKINSRLPRREQGIVDQRVADFTPDRWQVDFLDAVDQRQSVIIVAPTASGKTYASYYAMSKVLKDDSNGICIYIAPTKALINQVAGTIHSKFGPVFGIFTREYRMNMQRCQILVTIPECLEMLLLSTTHQRWCQRIQYCIFDEIHCMSGDAASAVWERAMLLINCPMIGLSATVNNGEYVRDWIGHVEKQRCELFKLAKPRPVCFISHHERLADLNKYLYSNRHLHALHPMALMNSQQLTDRGLPQDFSLSPCETLRLKEAMTSTDAQSKQLPNLADSFSPGWIIERSACNRFSRVVCQQFNSMIDNHQNAAIDSISTALNPTSTNQLTYPEIKPMASLMGEFVLTLKEKNLLPCIVFTDSRPLCEELAESVARYFEELEDELRRTKYRREIEALEKRLAQIEKAQKKGKAKKVVKTTTKRGGGGGDEEERDDNQPAELQQMEEEDQSQMNLSGYEHDLLNGVLDEGTLANRRGCDRELVDRLIERASTVNPRLVRYLKRGVAYHHPQLNNKGRLAVEGLFRNRYVQIVFSTWTLALGVHMPTKTVAFVKDSIYLDALQYRQSSGRAGRRGFDVQGNIVFIDIPMSKIRHLTLSAIPNIRTHFPTSVTFLMRLLYLCSTAEDKKDAINRSLVSLQCPFNAQSSVNQRFTDLQIRYHCLHTLDFLYRLNLIDGQGDLIGLAGLATHLHKFEPANLLLAYLFDTRLFHQLTDEEDIVNVLAYLFTSMPWFITQQQGNGSSARHKLSPATNHILRPMSADILQRIQAYNAVVKEIYGSYIENVSRQMRSLDENNQQGQTLPLSHVSFVQASDYDNGSFEYNLHHHHSQQSQQPSISPFSAPSGLTHEQFMANYQPSVSSWDLAYDLDLSSRIVPLMDIDARDHTNTGYYLNSYALDFFKHGSEASLMSENEVDRSETYHLLADFLQLLKSLEISLNTILVHENKQATAQSDATFFRPLDKKFTDIHLTFSKKFYREYK